MDTHTDPGAPRHASYTRVTHVRTRDDTCPHDHTLCVFPSSYAQGCVLSHTGCIHLPAHTHTHTHTFIPHAVGSATVPPRALSGAILERWKPGQSPCPAAAWGNQPLSPEASSPSFPRPQPLVVISGRYRAPASLKSSSQTLILKGDSFFSSKDNKYLLFGKLLVGGYRVWPSGGECPGQFREAAGHAGGGAEPL